MTDSSWQPTRLDDVLVRRIPRIADERGSFSELWRDSQTRDYGDKMVQLNLSRSRAGVLRGMHFHQRQVDVWTVVEGRVIAATTDVRPLLRGTASAPMTQMIEMGPGDSLFIPRQVAHGFWAQEDLALLYLVSNEYDGTDELGFAWNDPAAGIDWPQGDPIVSERDRSNPPLAELIARLTTS